MRGRRWPDIGWDRGGPDDLPTEAGGDPDRPGRLPFPRRARPGHLRRQGQVAAPAAVVLLPGHHRPAPAHGHDGHDRRVGRVDRRAHRGRGAPARVLLDQGVRPALQRQVPRRQVLPLPRRHDGRGVPARPGDARRQAQGHPLLRALRPRVGDPRDPRPAAARLPRAHLLLRRVQARGSERAAVPARLHRQVLGALRRTGHAPRSTGPSPRTSATSWAATRPVSPSDSRRG